MIIEASDVLNDAVASGVPNIDAEGEVGLGLHGQVRLDSSWPAGDTARMRRVLAFVKYLFRFSWPSACRAASA